MSALRDAKSSNGLAATVATHLQDYFSGHDGLLPPSGLYERVLQEVERPLLLLTLRECRGNQIKAAAILGINRNTLRKKLRDLGITAKQARR
ncbi:MAG: helix-turn-helix domain-containing protein [Alphaproteobacteria bacterium]